MCMCLDYRSCRVVRLMYLFRLEKRSAERATYPEPQSNEDVFSIVGEWMGPFNHFRNAILQIRESNPYPHPTVGALSGSTTERHTVISARQTDDTSVK